MRNLGAHVLELAATRYAEDSRSWAFGYWGTRHDGKGLGPVLSDDDRRNMRPGDPCCGDIAIQLIGGALAGDNAKSREFVINDARRVFCTYLGLEPCQASIVRWNDTEGRTRQQMIDALRAAAKADGAVTTTAPVQMAMKLPVAANIAPSKAAKPELLAA